MEFKEYLQIIKKNQTFFLFIWLSIVFLGLFTIFVQRDIYQGEMTVLVGRDNNLDGLENLPASESIFRREGDYDYYYQLEANKNISAILVKFLQDKALMKNVLLRVNGNSQLSPEDYWISSKINGKILGAGYIKVIIKSHQPKKIENIAKELGEKMRHQVELIGNKKQAKINLVIMPTEVELQKKPYLLVFLVVFFGGLLVAIFSVLFKYYWEDEK